MKIKDFAPSFQQAIRNFLDEKLSELEENEKSMIFMDHLHQEYSEYCKYNSIINCFEDKRYKFGKYVKAIIGAGYNGWKFDEDMLSIDRQHRGALVFRTRESDAEKEKLCEPDKNTFLEYYTKEYLEKLKSSLKSHTKNDLENMLIDYINQKINLRVKVGAGKMLGRPW